jgi:DNA mismatch endonuclease (patch repair protein)
MARSAEPARRLPLTPLYIPSSSSVFLTRAMADVFTKKKRSEIMSLIRSRGNKETELKLASILRAHGVTGWRRHQPLPGHPDFTFRREHLVIFVDGCFWHGCPKHLRRPNTNKRYWRQKIARNRQRDGIVTRMLRRMGWRVLRVWGHELKNESTSSPNF